MGHATPARQSPARPRSLRSATRTHYRASSSEHEGSLSCGLLSHPRAGGPTSNRSARSVNNNSTTAVGARLAVRFMPPHMSAYRALGCSRVLRPYALLSSLEDVARIQAWALGNSEVNKSQVALRRSCPNRVSHRRARRLTVIGSARPIRAVPDADVRAASRLEAPTICRTTPQTSHLRPGSRGRR
jgi:hypothetical protein